MTGPGVIVATGVLAFILVAVLTEAMRRVAIRHRLVDKPRADRVHAIATPYLGGVAISGGTVAAVAGLAHTGESQTLAIIIAGSAMSLLGLLDDIGRVSQGVRLASECLAAISMVIVGIHVDVFARVPVIGGWIDAAGTVIWIVVITNSFNLLDNMDGSAAAIAFASPPILAVLALATGRQGAATLLVALSAACAGFLVHNWTPARIFMGDAGSLFLGFVISSSTVLICSSGYFPNASVAAVAAALLLMAFVPVVDTCTVMISRQRAGQRWNHGGTDHISHRLRAVGLSTSYAAILLSLITAITTALGSLAVGGIVPARELLGATVLIVVTVVALALKVEVKRSRAAEEPRTSGTAPAREGSLRLGAAPNGLVPGQRLARDSAVRYDQGAPGGHDRAPRVRLPR